MASTIPAALLLVACPMLFAWTPAARAADPDGSRACMTPATRTAEEIAACQHGVGEAAEARLNDTYQKALATLDTASAALLRQSQRYWMAFRQAEVAAHDGPWRAGRSTIKRMQASDATIGAVNERERELRVYLPE